MKITDTERTQIKSLLRNFNDIYSTFYSLKFSENKEGIFLDDRFKKFYYGEQDFANALEYLETSLKEILKNQDIYLDCVIPGKWQISK